MTQLDLFSALRGPMIRLAVDPDGPVVSGDIDETLRLPQPRMAWAAARIELHQDRASGHWMWSASYHSGLGGHSYRVGTKWGRFAQCRDDALYYAIAEIRDRLADSSEKDARRICAWLDGLMPA